MVDQCVCQYGGMNSYLCLNTLWPKTPHTHTVKAPQTPVVHTRLCPPCFQNHLFDCFLRHTLRHGYIQYKALHISFLSHVCIAKIPFYSPSSCKHTPTHTHIHPHRHLWPLSVECYHLCGVEWVQRSLLTARCMQLNHIKVISPTEVIASRWFPCRNMLLMKLLRHCGCVRLWHSKHELAGVCSVCWGVLPFGCNTRGSTWLDSGWSFSGSVPVSACY